jgi:glycosyltransferase involved in cell wall biosynthesis
MTALGPPPRRPRPGHDPPPDAEPLGGRWLRRRQRVGVLFPHRQLGGGETAMIAVAEGLRRWFEVAVCALDRRAPPSGGTAGTGLDLHPELRARFGEVTLAATAEQLQDALAGVDAVVWYGLNALTPQTLAAMPHRPRSLRVVHTDKEQEIEYHDRWRQVIDATCCVSPAMQRQIAGAAFIPNACSPDRLRGRRRRLFPAVNKAAPATTTDHHRAPLVLGYAGRLLRFKNLAWLVERLEELDCCFVVQGIDTEDQTCAELAALASHHGAAHRLRFLPPAPQVGTLLRSIDAAIVLSLHEGFPMLVVEAGMLGVPVIATRAGALPELFAEEILFIDAASDEPDEASMRQALATLSPAHGQRLREKVKHLCARRTVAGLYAARLREVLADRP